MEITKKQLFKRQTTLSEIGEEGQQLLQNSRVLVIGCGGLGSPVAVQLACSGVGALHLVDFDTIDVSNLHRQIYFGVQDIGKPKATTLAKFIEQRAPFTEVTFSNEAVSKDNIIALIKSFDVVVDGTDSLPVKYLINDACVLQKKPLVYGSLYKFDGYVATFNVGHQNGDYSCNLRDAFPEMASDIPNCEEAGTLNSIVGIIATMQVNEVLKLLTKTGNLLMNTILIYNSLENTQLKIKLKKNTAVQIDKIFSKTSYLEKHCEIQDSALLMTARELKPRLVDEKLKLISVINDTSKTLPFDVDEKMPYETFDVNHFHPDFKKYYVVVCNRGITSYDVTLKLKDKFPLLSVFSLSEGIENY